MKTTSFILTAALLLGVSFAGAQNPPQSGANAAASAEAAQGQTGVAAGTTIHAELSKSLDAKKAKVGQEVQARVTQDVRSGGRVMVPRGAKLIGHVTAAKARAKGDANAESELAIAFDHAVLKGGEQVPVHAVIQALAAPPPPVSSAYGDMSDAGAGEPGMQQSASGGMAQPGRGPGGVVGDVGQTAGRIGGNVGAQSAGELGGVAGETTAATRAGATAGVSGLNGITLDTAATSDTQGSVLRSRNRDVKLDSGTQLVLRVTAVP
ncbi:MAG TPA: hypothetical protein VFU76_17490 [Terriglobales bacterium]|nr:hypothetical protein [Terriglobales bacterium]